MASGDNYQSRLAAGLYGALHGAAFLCFAHPPSLALVLARVPGPLLVLSLPYTFSLTRLPPSPNDLRVLQSLILFSIPYSLFSILQVSPVCIPKGPTSLTLTATTTATAPGASRCTVSSSIRYQSVAYTSPSTLRPDGRLKPTNAVDGVVADA